MNEIDLQKRNFLKKSAITAGAVGVGLLALSPLASATTMFRSNSKNYSMDNVSVANVGCVVDGAGAVISTGLKSYVQVPYNGEILSWTLIADASGSIVIDIWKDTYANFPPTVADTITASAKPTLSSQRNATDSTLTGWTKTITAGDILFFNVDSASTITKVALNLKVRKQEA